MERSGLSEFASEWSETDLEELSSREEEETEKKHAITEETFEAEWETEKIPPVGVLRPGGPSVKELEAFPAEWDPVKELEDHPAEWEPMKDVEDQPAEWEHENLDCANKSNCKYASGVYTSSQ